MEHTEHTTTVDASQSIVWELLADIESYPSLFSATQSVTIVEGSPEYQLAELVVDVSGELQSWTTRRDLDAALGVIKYRQLQTAPLVQHMGGEWRALPLGPNRTQLVLTHDFAAKQESEDGAKVAGKYSSEEAHQLLADAVENNSVAHLAAIRDVCERRAEVTAAAGTA